MAREKIISIEYARELLALSLQGLLGLFPAGKRKLAYEPVRVQVNVPADGQVR